MHACVVYMHAHPLRALLLLLATYRGATSSVLSASSWTNNQLFMCKIADLKLKAALLLWLSVFKHICWQVMRCHLGTLAQSPPWPSQHPTSKEAHAFATTMRLKHTVAVSALVLTDAAAEENVQRHPCPCACDRHTEQ